MILLVGLGNPEGKYQNNRHNVGFQLIDAIADHYSFQPERKKFKGLVREGTIDGKFGSEKFVLLKPQTYYNESGNSVREALNFYKLSLDDLYVIHDELDLAPGKIKVKKGGTNAGNNGLKSITAHLSQDFHRIRIGIGHPGDKNRVTQHVLGDFSKAEHSEWLDDLSDAIIRAIPLLCSETEPSARFLSDVALQLSPSKTEKPAQKKQAPPEKPTEQKKQKSDNSDAEENNPFSKLKNLFPKS